MALSKADGHYQDAMETVAKSQDKGIWGFEATANDACRPDTGVNFEALDINIIRVSTHSLTSQFWLRSS